MQSKKGLFVISGVLVFVIALAAVGYNVLGAQQSTVPNLTTISSSAATTSSPGGSSASASADAATNEAASSAEQTTQAPTADAVSSTDASSSSSQEAEPMRFADFTVTDLDGNSVNLSSAYGKPTLLGFWATWCPPCNQEAPGLQKLYETYGDRVNFMMVDAASDGRDNADIVRNWMDEGGYTYPVYLDLTGDASIECQIHYLPTMIVLDKEGNVLTGFSGVLDEESGVQLIEQLLAL